MTNQLTLRSLDIPTIRKFGVGFDSMFDELNRAMHGANDRNYPPYNIIKQSDNIYVIEIAVAGFTKSEIDITVDESVLSITGKHGDKSEVLVEYLHQGISNRDFARTFNLAEYVEVVDATVVDGVLRVILERRLPESKLPKKIDIK